MGPFDVPAQAADLAFCDADGDGLDDGAEVLNYDNNNGSGNGRPDPTKGSASRARCSGLVRRRRRRR